MASTSHSNRWYGAAKICGTNSSSQTCAGFKLVDVYAIDPFNSTQYTFHDSIENNEDHSRILYKGCQAIDTCAIAIAIAVMKYEIRALVDTRIGPFIH